LRAGDWAEPAFRAALLVAVAVGAACGDDDSDEDESATPTSVHWSYEGEAGPEHWAELSPDFATCDTGDEQSPVELSTAVPRDLPEIVFEYAPSPLTIQNNGHTIQVDYEAGSSITVGSEAYELVQFHFHAHSEHTIGGETFPLEMHLVHRAEDGALAVIGVLMEEGAANPAFDPVFNNLPAEETERETVEGANVSAGDLLPEGTEYFAYPGSLTTPPCSEGVSWFVLSEFGQLSEEQIRSFTVLFDDNFRPTQPLGEREILLEDGPAN
jgi:carbonic anhydrase